MLNERVYPLVLNFQITLPAIIDDARSTKIRVPSMSNFLRFLLTNVCESSSPLLSAAKEAEACEGVLASDFVGDEDCVVLGGIDVPGDCLPEQ
jgi:hypothetical protein